MSTADSSGAPDLLPLLRQGTASQNAGDLAAAERFYRAALRLDPGDPQALCLLGMLAGLTGRLPVAAAMLRRGLERDPGNADLHHNLGETYRHLGDFAAAIECFRRAAALRPQQVAAYRGAADAALALAQQAAVAGQKGRAQEFVRRATGFLAEFASAATHIGRAAEAEAAWQEALKLLPRDAALRTEFAIWLRLRGRAGESLAELQRALTLDARHALGHLALGDALLDLDRRADAAVAYRRGAALAPGTPEAAQGAAALRLAALGDGTVSAAESFAELRDWGTTLAARQKAPAAPFANARDPDRRLLVGFVSPDFRQHSVAYFFEPLLAALDRSAVESVCYANVAPTAEDETTARLRRLAPQWRPVAGLDDEALRRQIRADGIDILIDLAGHTVGNRLAAFAVKPAPVTATWLGWPATTGLPAIDWRITDAIADPPGAEAVHTERLLRLPAGFLCYRAPEEAPAVAPLPCRARGAVTFGSFNDLRKVREESVALWAEVLRAVPGARFLCKAGLLADPAVRQRLVERFARHGIAAERLDLRPHAPERAAHLAAYGEIDVALDTLPYNGATTSCEALWMGVPVVTLAGDRHAARVGASLLTAAGLPQLIAADSDEFRRIATGLAKDSEALATMRAGLRAKLASSALCDAAGFAGAFTAALRQIWTEAAAAGW